MRKIMFSILMVLGFGAESFAFEMATVNFPVIACTSQKFAQEIITTQSAIVASTGKMIPEKLIVSLAKEKGTDCITLNGRNTKIKVFKKFKKIVKNSLYPKGQIYHYAKIRVDEINGQKIVDMLKSDLEKKTYEKLFYWIALPITNEKIHMFTLDNGKTW